jgi:hypothetical protein
MQGLHRFHPLWWIRTVIFYCLIVVLTLITLVFYLVASIRNWRSILDPMSVNLDKRPILNIFYRQKVWENKVTIPAHKQNLFNAFVRFSWCFEWKSGICLVVYNLHLITMILLYHRNVRMDRKLMIYDAVLTSIFISFVYSTLND